MPLARLAPPDPCCGVTAIEARTGTVTAKVNATGQSFTFRSGDARALLSIKVGSSVYANFTTRQVSLDGRSACCPITGGPLAAAVAPVVPPLSQPDPPPPVTLPGTADVAGHALVLNGAATFTKVYIKIYVAGLYLTAKSADAGGILAADSARRMAIYFVFHLSKIQLCDQWKDALAANTPGASPQLKAKFVTLCANMADIDSQQQMLFTYLPDTGTEVRVAGSVKVTIPGKDFADAMLNAWIGPHPAAGEDFKQRLLGMD